MEKITRRLSNSLPFTRKQRKESDNEFNLTYYSLNKEEDRKRTFTDNQWSDRNVTCTDLALLGFYYLMKPDVVRCNFCQIVLRDFSPNDEVLKDHLTFSPNCPLIRRRETNNVPIDCEKLESILPPASYDECGSRRRKKSRVEEDIAHPEYRLPSARLSSFNTWPVGIKQKPKDLSDAGFFYSGRSDYTICFSCGVVIGKWEADDNPWVEHKKLSTKDCSYLKLNHEQVTTNEKLQEELMKAKTPLEETVKDEDADEKEVDYENACKICLSRKSSIVFLPCKHVAVCGECAFGLSGKCPICRAEIAEMFPLYYA